MQPEDYILRCLKRIATFYDHESLVRRICRGMPERAAPHRTPAAETEASTRCSFGLVAAGSNPLDETASRTSDRRDAGPGRAAHFSSGAYEVANQQQVADLSGGDGAQVSPPAAATLSRLLN